MAPTPLCKCRVLYIGSAVPTATKDGLQGIQEPLRERYSPDESGRGIDSWLSVWSNGILLEHTDGDSDHEQAFYAISTLHYCAAVRYVDASGFAVEGGGARFLPLDSPFAQVGSHPPMFAAMLRRTSGVRVLECHAFICLNERAANALVRACFHAYADHMYMKMEAPPQAAIKAAPEDNESAPSSSPSGDNSEQDVPRWSARAISQEAWRQRQQVKQRVAKEDQCLQAGDYEVASISSSQAGRYARKDKKTPAGRNEEHAPRAHQPDDDIVPMNGFAEPPPGMLPPPGMMPPPPPGALPPLGMMPPPHMLPPPGPMPPPPMMGPPHGMMPPPHMMNGPVPPPHMMPPGYMPPPPMMGPMGPMPPPGMMPLDMGPPPSVYGGDSHYGTIRREGPIIEEPTYGTMDNRTMQRGTHKRNESRQEDFQESYWEQMESGIYRRPMPHERAFAATVRQPPQERPPTPPADYYDTVHVLDIDAINSAYFQRCSRKLQPFKSLP